MSLETGQEQEVIKQEDVEIEQEVVEQETVTSEPKQEAAESSEEVQEPKTFTQEELDEIVEKRLARERRKQEREQQEAKEPPPLQLESKLNPEDYATTEAYIEALADERAEALIEHKQRYKAAQAANQKYQEQIDAAVDKYPDYAEVAHTHPFMTQEMAASIQASDIAADLGYYLGSNLEEAERIAKLPPLHQVRELGKLEAKLEANPPKGSKVSEAPDPITPIAAAKTSTPAYDTTDPRSADTMSTSEWIAADRARRQKLLKQQGYK